MEEKEILANILEIVKPYVKDEVAFKNANYSTRFIEDLKINSARLIDIILDVEDKFQLSINDDESMKMLTIGDAMHLITQKGLIDTRQ